MITLGQAREPELAEEARRRLPAHLVPEVWDEPDLTTQERADISAIMAFLEEPADLDDYMIGLYITERRRKEACQRNLWIVGGAAAAGGLLVGVLAGRMIR